MPLSPIEDIIDEIRQGRMVVLVDDEDRENEGDLLMAAQFVTANDINFMAKYGRGLICLTLTRERCQQLKLPLMVSKSDEEQTTNFTVSIEASTGVTTGISAADRATTVLAAVAMDARPEDIDMPGHIFPLMAQPGGVLTRAGHTEAGCDLPKLADIDPASVIVEILNEDGSMARRPDLEIFCQQHGLKMGMIADLIKYRIKNEKSIERVSECNMPTSMGEFRMLSYLDATEDMIHYALVMGDLNEDDDVLVRVHVMNGLCDMLDARREECGWPLSRAMAQIQKEGKGVVVILSRREDSAKMIQRLRNYQIQDKGGRLERPTSSEDLRTYGVGAQIVADLGIRRMRVLGSPRKLHGLSGFGLKVVEYVQEE